MSALITKSLPFLNKLIPSGLAVKGLSKLDPRISSFITNAVGSGFAAENVVDYLRDRMSPEGDKMEANRLERGESQGNLSSQEEAALGKRRQEGGVGKLIGAGVGLATGLGGLAGSEEQGLQKPQGAQPPPMPPVQPPINPIEEARLTSLARSKQPKQSFQQREMDRLQGHYGQQDVSQSQAALQPQQQQLQQGDATQKLLEAIQQAAEARKRRQ